MGNPGSGGRSTHICLNPVHRILERFLGHGYANAAVWALVEAFGHDTLSLHSVVNITGFYGHYGFRPIPQGELPDSIRERFAWDHGEMQGANVCPMRRDAENH
mgnify:CR=1 FL=1